MAFVADVTEQGAGVALAKEAIADRAAAMAKGSAFSLKWRRSWVIWCGLPLRAIFFANAASYPCNPSKEMPGFWWGAELFFWTE